MTLKKKITTNIRRKSIHEKNGITITKEKNKTKNSMNKNKEKRKEKEQEKAEAKGSQAGKVTGGQVRSAKVRSSQVTCLPSIDNQLLPPPPPPPPPSFLTSPPSPCGATLDLLRQRAELMKDAKCYSDRRMRKVPKEVLDGTVKKRS